MRPASSAGGPGRQVGDQPQLAADQLVQHPLVGHGGRDPRAGGAGPVVAGARGVGDPCGRLVDRGSGHGAHLVRDRRAGPAVVRPGAAGRVGATGGGATGVCGYTRSRRRPAAHRAGSRRRFSPRVDAVGSVVAAELRDRRGGPRRPADAVRARVRLRPGDVAVRRPRLRRRPPRRPLRPRGLRAIPTSPAYDPDKYGSLRGYATDVVEICRELELDRRGLRRALGERDDRRAGAAAGARSCSARW